MTSNIKELRDRVTALEAQQKEPPKTQADEKKNDSDSDNTKRQAMNNEIQGMKFFRHAFQKRFLTKILKSPWPRVRDLYGISWDFDNIFIYIFHWSFVYNFISEFI